jgi:hypothetical protein
MATGNMMDLDDHGARAPIHEGPRPFLARGHMIFVRLLLAIYVPGFLLLLAMNIGPVGGAVFALASTHFWFAVTFGMVMATAWLTFLVLFGMCLFHFLRGHAGPKPPSWWLWVIILLNVAGVVAYYFKVLEPEQRALLAAHHA